MVVKRPVPGFGTVVIFLAFTQLVAIAMYCSRKEESQRSSLRSALPETLEVHAMNKEPAQPLALQTADGRAVDWAALRGKPVLLHFWASWCIPCREELPMLLEVASERASTLHVLAVSLDSDWAPVRLFLDGNIPRHVSMSSDASAAQRYGVKGLPDTFVINASGALIARLRGPRNWRSKDAQDALRGWELER